MGDLRQPAVGDDLAPGGAASAERAFNARPARTPDVEAERPEAHERLLYWIAGARYSSPLESLREALPVIPSPTLLPFSPVWLFGLFPLRTELVSLIDPRPFLDNAAGFGGEHDIGGGGTQALLVGETGRLIALVVDRIGDITGDTPVGARSGDVGEMAGGAVPDVGSASVTAGGEAAMALDLSALYVGVIARLEAWARDV